MVAQGFAPGCVPPHGYMYPAAQQPIVQPRLPPQAHRQPHVAPPQGGPHHYQQPPPVFASPPSVGWNAAPPPGYMHAHYMAPPPAQYAPVPASVPSRVELHLHRPASIPVAQTHAESTAIKLDNTNAQERSVMGQPNSVVPVLPLPRAKLIGATIPPCAQPHGVCDIGALVSDVNTNSQYVNYTWRRPSSMDSQSGTKFSEVILPAESNIIVPLLGRLSITCTSHSSGRYFTANSCYDLTNPQIEYEAHLVLTDPIDNYKIVASLMRPDKQSSWSLVHIFSQFQECEPLVAPTLTGWVQTHIVSNQMPSEIGETQYSEDMVLVKELIGLHRSMYPHEGLFGMLQHSNDGASWLQKQLKRHKKNIAIGLTIRNEESKDEETDEISSEGLSEVDSVDHSMDVKRGKSLIDYVLSELQGLISCLLIKRYGSVYMASLFEACDQHQRLRFLEDISISISLVSSHSFGCQSMLRILEAIETEELASLVITELCKEDLVLSNNHKCFVILKTMKKDIFQPFVHLFFEQLLNKDRTRTGSLLLLLTEKNCSKVLSSYLELTCHEKKSSLVEAVLKVIIEGEYIKSLCHHQYGQKVLCVLIQNLQEYHKVNQETKGRFLDKLFSLSMTTLAKHPISNEVVMSLLRSNSKERTVEALFGYSFSLKKPTDEDSLIEGLSNNVSNRILLSILATENDIAAKRILCELVAPFSFLGSEWVSILQDNEL